MKCPTCGCERFYIKDSDDEYEIYEFTTAKGTIEFDSKEGSGSEFILRLPQNPKI